MCTNYPDVPSGKTNVEFIENFKYFMITLIQVYPRNYTVLVDISCRFKNSEGYNKNFRWMMISKEILQIFTTPLGWGAVIALHYVI